MRNLHLATVVKKLQNPKVTVTRYNWYDLNNHQRIGKGSGKLGNKRTIRDHTDYKTIKIGEKTEESSGELGITRVTQTPVINHQLMQVGPNEKELDTLIQPVKISYLPNPSARAGYDTR